MEKTIWDFLLEKIGNRYGVAGLMGNLYAESGLQSDNMQNCYEGRYNDNSYTDAVDNGSYTDFVNDAIGYGLAQWTYYVRKQNLLNYAKSKNVSISDLNMQLEFLYKELSESYVGVLNTLKNATSILEASNSVLFKFESPADQSTSVQNVRAYYGQTFYNKYAEETVEEVENTESEEATYTVVAGDNLTKIAEKFNTTVDNLVALNNIVDKDTIYIGQVLQLKGNVNLNTTYTVVAGDRLYDIAKRFNTTVNALATLNNIANPDIIYIGQVLLINGTSNSTSNTYTVVAGDRLYDLAKKFNTTVDNLVTLNDIANPDIIYIGQVLRIS